MIKLMGATDTGRLREQNEDAFICRQIGEQTGYAIVCDGMGGENAGDVASATACRLIEKFFHRDIREGMSEGSAKAVIFSAISAANAKVYSMARENPAYHGMGTTLVAALAGEEEALILNEGDSRAYHISEESGISQVTRDHSLVEDLVERGELTRDQARVHPHKNLITRALGAEPDLKADSFRRELTEGDFLLLCSDGLSNVVSEQEILYEVVHGGEACTCCRRLLDIALHRGAPDNVTAVLIQIAE